MANPEHIEILKKGSVAWNEWREFNKQISPDLSDINFFGDIHVSKHLYDLPEYNGYNLSSCNLNRVSMRNCTFTLCNFSDSSIHFSDLVDSYCSQCDFSRAGLRVSKIGSAEFIDCDFNGTDMSYCSAEETNFTGSKLINTKLNNMSLVKTNFTNTTIDGSCVYGVSAWDLILEGSHQQNIYISEQDISITVPTIELAQFISLLVNNSKFRDIIDTITSKVVLILGRFTEERKLILDQIKDELQKRDYLPVLFDFEGPTSRDITETVLTLATLAKFIVADISDPRSIPQELNVIVKNLPSVPVQPVLHEDQEEYGMFEHFKSFPWVLTLISYAENDVSCLVNNIVGNCEKYLTEKT